MFEPLPEHPEFYSKIPSGYKVEISGHMIEPMIYQPTTAGMEILTEHYKTKYAVDIRVIDQSKAEVIGDNLKHRFAAFKTFLDSKKDEIEKEISAGKQIGFVLTHGCNHTIPLIISKDRDGNKVMTIFDSTSGPRTKGYYLIANMFDDYNLMLNNGSRQKDGQSCMVDSIAILKDALRMPDLAQYLITHKIMREERAREEDEKEAGAAARPRQFFGTALTRDNFKLFLMPEELLKTAQRSEFAEESKPDETKIITASNKTLEQKRGENRVTVHFDREEGGDLKINQYLHKKSWKYAKIISEELEKRTPSVPSSSTRGAAAGAVSPTAEECLKL